LDPAVAWHRHWWQPVYADGPRPGFKLNADPTITSPGQALRVEQYSKDLKDQGVRYQVLAVNKAAPKDRKMLASRGKISMLQPKPLRWPSGRPCSDRSRARISGKTALKVIASSIRKGNVIEQDGKLYVVLTAENIHPGKGTPVSQIEIAPNQRRGKDFPSATRPPTRSKKRRSKTRISIISTGRRLASTS